MNEWMNEWMSAQSHSASNELSTRSIVWTEMSWECVGSYQRLHLSQVRSQPSDNGGGVGRFPQILDLFQGVKIGVPSSCLGEPMLRSIWHVRDMFGIYCFRDIRGQNLGFWGPLGVPPKDFEANICAKFHADWCNRSRNICNRTADLISD